MPCLYSFLSLVVTVTLSVGAVVYHVWPLVECEYEVVRACNIVLHLTCAADG